MKNPGNESTSESEGIRSDIEQTRESMDRTLDEIGERIKPRHLLDQVLDLFRSPDGASTTAGTVLTSVGKSASRAATGVVDVVRRHPVPTLLIGAGITWALVENRRRANGHTRSGEAADMHESWDEGEDFEASEVEALPHVSATVGEKISDTAADAAKSVKEAGQSLKQKTQQVGQTISKGARAVGRTAQRGYSAGRTKFVEASETYPIAVGMGFLSAGILLGLTLPHSRKEDQWVGQVSDRAKQRVKAKGQDLMERGRDLASAATSAATQAVKETANKEGLTGQPA